MSLESKKVIVFYVNFDDWRLATMAFVSLSLYGYVTVRVTLWRKKFRQATNKHDNDYHDKATDRWETRASASARRSLTRLPVLSGLRGASFHRSSSAFRL